MLLDGKTHIYEVVLPKEKRKGKKKKGKPKSNKPVDLATNL